jgi:hypothetical protein
MTDSNGWRRMRRIPQKPGGDLMKWLRFSIASVMAFILYAAIGLAAYANVDNPWYGRLLDDTYYMITVLLLAIATMLAVLRRNRSQAMWLGFAVFGWVHLLFGWPDSGGNPRRDAIVNSAGVAGTYRPRFPHMTLAYWTLDVFRTFAGGSNPLKSDYTWHVLQSTVTMATAVVGAIVGSFLWRRGEQVDGNHREASVGGGGGPSGSSA